MYGTVARCRIKPRMERQLAEQVHMFEAAKVSGVEGAFLLRACVVNFRTSLEDIEALPGMFIRIGREVDAALRPVELKN